MSLYRAEVVRVDYRGVYVTVPVLGQNSYYGPIEPIPEVAVAVGDRVLCGDVAGQVFALELVRKTGSSALDPVTPLVESTV